MRLTGAGDLGIGTTLPGTKLDVAGAIRSSNQFISTLATGTAPLSVLSTTKVANLNVDLFDDLNSDQFLRSDTSDSFTSGTLSFSDATFLDLSAIAHDDTAPQGVRLPQGATLSEPSSGEGYNLK